MKYLRPTTISFIWSIFNASALHFAKDYSLLSSSTPASSCLIFNSVEHFSSKYLPKYLLILHYEILFKYVFSNSSKKREEVLMKWKNLLIEVGVDFRHFIRYSEWFSKGKVAEKGCLIYYTVNDTAFCFCCRISGY